MNKIIFLLFFLFSSHFLFGQSTGEIDRQVWIPFIQSFNSNDDEGYKAVHSKSIIRIEQDSKMIFTYDQYFQKLPDSLQKRKNAWKNTIELRFVQRIDDTNIAFEVGYFKTSSIHTVTNRTRVSYGKFHVLLRKENDVWKIVMDADSAEGVTEEVFLAAPKLNTSL